MKFKKMTLLEKIQTIIITVLVLIIVVIGTNYINKLYKSNTEKEYNSINYLEGNNEEHTVDELYALLQTMETRVNNLSTSSIETEIGNLTNKNSSNNVFLKTYPVGSIYISNTNTNPGTIFGGTWTAFGTGRTLVGVDTSQTEFNTVEKTGGAKTHTHTLGSGYAKITAWSGVARISYYELSGKPSWTANYETTTAANGTSSTRTSTYGAGLGGNADSSSNLSPYITVYMWKRTA